jgi:hypothetical protein
MGAGNDFAALQQVNPFGNRQRRLRILLFRIESVGATC